MGNLVRPATADSDAEDGRAEQGICRLERELGPLQEADDFVRWRVREAGESHRVDRAVWAPHVVVENLVNPGASGFHSDRNVVAAHVVACQVGETARRIRVPGWVLDDHIFSAVAPRPVSEFRIAKDHEATDDTTAMGVDFLDGIGKVVLRANRTDAFAERALGVVADDAALVFQVEFDGAQHAKVKLSIDRGADRRALPRDGGDVYRPDRPRGRPRQDVDDDRRERGVSGPVDGADLNWLNRGRRERLCEDTLSKRDGQAVDEHSGGLVNRSGDRDRLPALVAILPGEDLDLRLLRVDREVPAAPIGPGKKWLVDGQLDPVVTLREVARLIEEAALRCTRIIGDVAAVERQRCVRKDACVRRLDLDFQPVK